MRVLIINTSEQTGGAAIAAGRLTEALRASGVEAEMLVMHKSSQKPYVLEAGTPLRRKAAFLLERLVIWTANLFSRKDLFKVSIANTGQHITSLPAFRQADIIHLHWINQGMLSLREIDRIMQAGKPVVWTLHDMWECTAICHHAYQCRRYETQCHHCPFLRLPGRNDLAARVFRQKERIFSHAPLHVVTVSQWLRQKVEQSALLGNKPVTVIPNTLSTTEFTLHEAAAARRAFGLPVDKQIILFGAARIDDPIKGFPLLLKSLQQLLRMHPETGSRLHLVLFGGLKSRDRLRDVPVSYTYLGTVRQTADLSRLYGAADVLVSASYYETFGQTLIEAQACGCVPVAFGGSGQQDIISHKANGYLADYLSTRSLAEGIYWAMTEGAHLSRQALRQTVVSRYATPVVARSYRELYRSLLHRPETHEEDAESGIVQPTKSH